MATLTPSQFDQRLTPIAVPLLLRLPYPLRNMARRWRGMLGMVVGVGIALSIGMTILAVIQAELNQLSGGYQTSGASLYVVTHGGSLVALLPGETPGTIKRAHQTMAQIRGMPGVRAVVGAMNWTMARQRPGATQRNTPTELLVVMGIDGDPSTIPNFLDLKQGRWLRRSREIVLGSKVSKDKGIGVGGTIDLNGENFTVVGIGKLRAFGFGADSVVYMDGAALRQRGDVGDLVNVIAVDSSQPTETLKQIENLGTLSAFTPDELVQQTREADAGGIVIDWILIGLTLAVAALFVSSMLSHSVSERRLEFATLRAIGMPARTILVTVAGEAIFISAAASAFGVVLSLGFGVLLNEFAAPAYDFDSLYDASVGLFLLIFGLALGLGLISGLFPARHATRVDPIEVLREA